MAMLSGPESGAQARKVLLEGDVERPVEAVFDGPVALDGVGAGWGVERARDDVEALLAGDPAPVLDCGLDLGGGGEAGEARRAGVGVVGVQPSGDVGDAGCSGLDAAAALVDGGRHVQLGGGRGVEIGPQFGVQGRLVGLDRQEVVGTGGGDRLGGGRVAAHGVDGDQRALQVEPLQQRRDGPDLVGLVLHRLLAQHQPAPGGEGGDQVQRVSAPGVVVAAPHALAVDGHKVGAIGKGLLDPGQKAGGEQRPIHPVHQRRHPVGAGNAMVVGREATQEVQVRLAPGDDVLVVVTVRHRPAHGQEQHFLERVGHLPGLARVAEGGELVQQQGQSRLGAKQVIHEALPNQRASSESSQRRCRNSDPQRQPAIGVNLSSEP